MFSILVFLVVLSILVFVHELGHFVAAKLCNVYVDRFSIGMPPRIFGIQWGETDYCVGALPIGGYVKMAGQEDAPLSEEERDTTYGHVPSHRWFNKKPIWQRIFILVAGPAMNLVLGFFLYAFLFGVGQELPESQIRGRIGMIKPDTPAASAPMWRLDAGPDTARPPDATGWRTGDVIVEMDGKVIRSFEDVLGRTVVGGGAERRIIIERENPEGAVDRYVSLVKPQLLGEEDSYPRFGIGPFAGVKIKAVTPDSPALAAGFEKGDEILAANGNTVDYFTFLESVEKSPAGVPLAIKVQRNGAPVDLSLQPRIEGRLNEVGFKSAPEGAEADTRIVVADVTDEYKKATRLQRKDVIAAVDDKAMTRAELLKYLQAHPGGEIKVKIERPSILFGLLQQAETLDLTLPVASVGAIGVELEPATVFYRAPLPELFSRALRETKDKCLFIFDLLAALVTQNVSMKELGGPVMIFQATSAVAEVGFLPLISLMALISINLGIFNLLPLPVLDGGQILINIVEAIRRRPLSITILERYQQVGLVMILALMVFVTWNDISRAVEGMLP